ncbi:TniQ family protein [Streptomyces althioticus]|uniref:TniQ family protein n=1 Tax=Streptomyces althioticus TaxID=83380 RepID=UPI0033DB4C23
MHPLPRSLDPLPGESLPGYLLRLSFRLDLSPADLGRSIGLPPSTNGHLTRNLLVDLPGPSLDAFVRATRLSRNEARGLTLGAWGHSYQPIRRSLPTRPGYSPPMNRWLFGTFPRYCPLCLAGNDTSAQRRYGGPWKREWHLGIVFACMQHECFLHHQCPRCHRPAAGGLEPTGLIPYDGFHGLHPAECRYLFSPRAGKRIQSPCRTRLDLVPLPTIQPTPQLLGLQRDLLTLLGSSEECSEANEYFSALHFLTVVVTATWPSSRHRVDSALVSAVDTEARGRSYFGTLRARDASPTNSMACGAVLGAAHSLLQSDRLSDVLAKSFESGLTNSPARTGLASIFAKYEGSCSQRLRMAAAPLIRDYSRHPGWSTFRPTYYRAEHISAHLEDGWYDRHLRNLDGQTDPEILRRIAAIQLVQWATQDSITEAARYLGIDISTMPHNAENSVHTWLNSPNEVRHFRQGLQNLAVELHRQADQLIDYQCRRDALHVWALTPDAWQRLIGQLQHTHDSRPALYDHMRQEASTFIWVHVTHGEHQFAPRPIEAEQPLAVQQDWARHRSNTWLQLSRSDRQRYSADLREVLIDHGRTLARHIDAGGLVVE